MKLGIAKIDKQGPDGTKVQGNFLEFVCAKPVIIQSQEILKVFPKVVVDLESGFVLNVSTHPKLAERGAEIFPSLIVLDEDCRGEFVIPIKHHGRDPLHLMLGDPVAKAYVSQTEKISVVKFDLEETVDSIFVEKSKPQKNQEERDRFKFEIK
jgi:dUTPase